MNMPLFDYKCEQCFKIEENVLIDVSDVKSEYKCKACGGFMMRQFPHSSFQLKGGGWYKDSYQKPSAETKPKPNNTEA